MDTAPASKKLKMDPALTTKKLTSDIRGMLFAFGDCMNPLMETASCIREILQMELKLVLEEAEKGVNIHNGARIGYKDALFAIRKDIPKLRGLIRHFLRSDRSYNKKQKMRTESNEAGIFQPQRKAKDCAEYLIFIGIDVLHGGNDGGDDVLNRTTRYIHIIENIPMNIYTPYLKSNRTTFNSSASRAEKFLDWLQQQFNFKARVANDSLVFDIIAFVAREIVIEIVDKVYKLRRDKIALSRGMEAVKDVSIYSVLRDERFDENGEVFSIRPIVPEEIIAVKQKFYSGQSKFIPILL